MASDISPNPQAADHTPDATKLVQTAAPGVSAEIEATVERLLTMMTDYRYMRVGDELGVAREKFKSALRTALLAGAAGGAEPTADAERPNNAVLVPCDKLAEVQKDVERLDFVLSAIVADEAKIIDILHDEDGLPLSRERMLENIDTARAAIDAARAGRKG